jgi:hypothetical protein
MIVTNWGGLLTRFFMAPIQGQGLLVNTGGEQPPVFQNNFSTHQYDTNFFNLFRLSF